EAVNALTQPYTGRNANLIAPASISNTIYGYNLAERKREKDEKSSEIYSNLLKEYTKVLKAKTK
ncbi:MAG: hypothetical protein U9O94_00495, partial [Nanoarchaeota archaeon]|nr:hypothetical protein [Nanoarchaeota archaeon]